MTKQYKNLDELHADQNPEWEVNWCVQVQANSMEEAAEKALQMMRNERGDFDLPTLDVCRVQNLTARGYRSINLNTKENK